MMYFIWWPGTELTPDASLFRAAYYQLIPVLLQQLNFAEWPIYCDHSVTSADVRLASALAMNINNSKSSDGVLVLERSL
jgi:hypothetical protein